MNKYDFLSIAALVINMIVFFLFFEDRMQMVLF